MHSERIMQNFFPQGRHGYLIYNHYAVRMVQIQNTGKTCSHRKKTHTRKPQILLSPIKSASRSDIFYPHILYKTKESFYIHIAPKFHFRVFFEVLFSLLLVPINVITMHIYERVVNLNEITRVCTCFEAAIQQLLLSLHSRLYRNQWTTLP